jgi:hypothetical protein
MRRLFGRAARRLATGSTPRALRRSQIERARENPLQPISSNRFLGHGQQLAE